MNQRVIVQNSEHQRHGDAVIRAQGGTVGAQHAVLHHQVDTLGLEVVFNPRQLIADHIDVALHHDGRGTLAPALAGFLMMTLYTSSWYTHRPRSLAKATKKSLMAFSSRDSRGIAAMSSKK